MSACPFPAIPAYLGKQRFPRDQLAGAKVTHVWTQDTTTSKHIACAARIPTVTSDYREMLGSVDAILLARDDAENHLEFAAPFLRAGLPVYLDKPAALSVADLDALFAAACSPEQIFSCSALRFAAELQLAPHESSRIGQVRQVVGTVPKSWARYAMHVIDPVVSLLAPGKVLRSEEVSAGARVDLKVWWESGCIGVFHATGELQGQIAIGYIGEHAAVTKVFEDSFAAFRGALYCFLEGIRSGQSASPYSHLRAVVELVELGMRRQELPQEST
jgi:predicted dehydrogenase